MRTAPEGGGSEGAQVRTLVSAESSAEQAVIAGILFAEDTAPAISMLLAFLFVVHGERATLLPRSRFIRGGPLLTSSPEATL